MSTSVGRQRLETAALLLAVFVAGGLGGAALERRAPEPAREGRSSRDFMSPPGEIPRFYEELDLSAAQRSEIERILEAARPESDSILREAMPRLREITRETRAAIADVLTDEQRARLEESIRHRRDWSRNGPPGRGRDSDHSRDDSGGSTGRGGGNP